MAQVKFFKKATAPAAIQTGSIWFDTTTQSIKVKTATGYDIFGIGLKDATLVNSILTITKSDNSTVTVDFSDIASASSVVAALALKADKTYVDSELAKKVDSTDVESGAQVNIIETVKVNGTALVPSDKTVDITIPAATVTGVKKGNNVIALEGTELIADLSLTYSSTEKTINLRGLNEELIASIDATEFIKDGMVNAVSFDPDTKELTITFNTDAGQDDIKVDLTDLVDTYTAGTGISIEDNVVSVDTTVIATKASVDNLSESLGTGFSSTSTVADQLAAVKTTADAAQTVTQVSSAINTAVAGLVSSSTGSGNLVVGVSQADGKVAVTMGSASIDDVTGLQAALDAKVASTTKVNGKALTADVTISGADVALTGYVKGVSGAIAATDTVNAALGKLEAKADAAMAGGVQSFAAQTGDITLKVASAENGAVNLSMSGNELQASIVGLKSAAYAETSAFDAAGAAEQAKTEAQEYTDSLFEWVEFE